jgi:hypothetical protein
MHQLLFECRFYFFLKYSLLSAYHVLFVHKKICFKEKSLYYFYKKLKIKKKNIFSGFLGGFFGFFLWFFYCQPWNRGLTICR